jgi:hypothetical protein
LALFSGFALDHIFNSLKQIKKAGWSLRAGTMVLIILLLLLMTGWDAANTLAGNSRPTLEDDEEEQMIDDREAIAFINKVSSPADCVIADNPVFLYHTQHLPPPELSEVSLTRIETGYLTLQDMIHSIQTHNCHVVATLTPRFTQEIPGLPEWLADHYLGLYRRDQRSIYFAKKGADDSYTPLPNSSFGTIVNLYGVHLSEQPWDRDEAIFISLFWQLETAFPNNYIEKITLREPASGKQLFQMARPPFEGQFDPALWQVDEEVKDTFWLKLPADISTGSYHLYLSLCIVETEECLPVNNEPGLAELFLGQIKVIE